MVNRMFVSVAVVSAAVFLGAGVPAGAYPQDPKHQGKEKEKGKQEEARKPAPQHGGEQRPAPPAPPQRGQDHRPEARPAQPPPPQAQPKHAERAQPQAAPPQRVQQQQQRQRVQPQAARPQAPPPVVQAPPRQAQPRQAPQRLAEPQQQVRVGQQQQRLVQYGAQLDQQQRLAPQQAVQLQQQHRTAQYGFQLQYAARLHDQQVRIENSRTYNYGGDPYFYTPFSFRYARGGRYYETNEYGANVLRQAVNDGYEEGFGSGRADRQDHWKFDYLNSYAYRDANYGYGGFYIERADYNYYFRQGFRRGYEDGYYSRSRYGVYSTGRYSVRAPVLSVIINFQRIR